MPIFQFALETILTLCVFEALWNYYSEPRFQCTKILKTNPTDFFFFTLPTDNITYILLHTTEYSSELSITEYICVMAVTLTVTMVSFRVKREGEAYNMQEYTAHWNHRFFTSHYIYFMFNHLQYL